MVSMQSPRLLGRIAAALVATAALGACSGPQISKQAGLLGYGTPEVSTYGQGAPASTLQEELDRCSGVPQTAATSQTQGLPAACNQLRHTVRNQPGNSVQPNLPPSLRR